MTKRNDATDAFHEPERRSGPFRVLLCLSLPFCVCLCMSLCLSVCLSQSLSQSLFHSIYVCLFISRFPSLCLYFSPSLSVFITPASNSHVHVLLLLCLYGPVSVYLHCVPMFFRVPV